MTTAQLPMIQKTVFSAPRQVEENTFTTAVRNSLSKIANLIGLDPWDRDSLMDLAHSSRVPRHWKQLLEEAGDRDIPEWLWNRYVRAATKECFETWLST